MRTIQTNLYKFDELSDKAKERAREWFRRCDDGEFAEYVFDDVATIADIIGIDLRQTRTDKGRYKPTIYYSGFSSQGDGACFTGNYSYKKGALKNMKAHIGNTSAGDIELLRICKSLQEVQTRNFYKLTAKCEHLGHYYHSGRMLVDVENSDDPYRDIGESETTVRQIMRDFADYIYQQLETEYDYQNSDAVVDENIAANEYEFYEDGGIA